jgi:general stress protein 26
LHGRGPMANAAIDSSSEAVERFRELVSKFKTAMFVTRGRDVALHGRPMVIADVEADATLWFITGLDSPKVHEMVANQDVVVCMQDDARFVTVNGRVELVSDRKRLDEVWRENFRIWFGSKDDPDIVLIRLAPTAGEYWDQSGIRGLKYAFRAAKAYVQNERMNPRADEPDMHAQLKL